MGTQTKDLNIYSCNLGNWGHTDGPHLCHLLYLQQHHHATGSVLLELQTRTQEEEEEGVGQCELWSMEMYISLPDLLLDRSSEQRQCRKQEKAGFLWSIFQSPSLTWDNFYIPVDAPSPHRDQTLINRIIK